jgi:DNA-binding winged helix-turn-helix (wHTH) protein/Tol biopolymer transport system component
MISEGKDLNEFGGFRVDPAHRLLLRDDKPVPLQPKAFDILLALLRNSEEVVLKDDLMKMVWPDTFVEEANLAQNISVLRKALGEAKGENRYIVTVPGKGYRFAEPVRSVSIAAGPAEEAEDVTVERRTNSRIVIESGAVGQEAVNSVLVSNGGLQALPGPTREALYKRPIVALMTLAVVLAGGLWYLNRPLPQPRITGYAQITHDGRDKELDSTDGSRLYFTQLSPRSIAQVSVNGGEVAEIPVSMPSQPFETSLLDVSPDGSNALIGTIDDEEHLPRSMWVAPTFGGAARRLEQGVNGVFSPDGASVIYSAPGGDIFVIRTDGTGRRKLASVSSAASWFRWSPDGKKIRFSKDGLLWEMSADGSEQHQLLPDWHQPGNQCCGSWTAEGRLYVFQLNLPSGGRSEIWALQEGWRLFHRGTAGPIRLTTGPLSWSRPIFSRDGKRIFAEGITQRGELSRIDLKTGETQALLGGISAEFVSFSNDGKSVAYVSYPDGVLWKADRDGNNRVQLSAPPVYAVNPRWSPDSKQILFMGLTPERRSAAYLVSAEGGAPRKLVADDNLQTGDASWSPDGRRILIDWGGLYSPPEKRELRILDLDSRQMTTIPGSKGLWSSRWSPDGRYVAAFLALSPPIRIFDFTTQQWAVVPLTGNAFFPTFSHDSRYLYFMGYGINQGLFRIPAAGGKEERLLDMTNLHLTGFYGHSLTLDPSDAPLVLRDTGGNDIYALTLETK